MVRLILVSVGHVGSYTCAVNLPFFKVWINSRFLPPILISNSELDPLLIFLRRHETRFFKCLTFTTGWLQLPQSTTATLERGLNLHVARRMVVCPVVAILRVGTALIVEVRCTVGFAWRCLLKQTISINAARTISSTRWRSYLTSLDNTVPKWSEVTTHLILRWTHSVHHTSWGNGMTQVLFVEHLRTCESYWMLLCQWAGEWTGNMVRASSRYVKKMLGPSVGIKWVQHGVAHVIASVWPRCSKGGRINRLPVASYITFLFTDGWFNVVILLLKLPEFINGNRTVTMTNSQSTSMAWRYASNVRVIGPHVQFTAIEGRSLCPVGLELDTTTVTTMKVFLVFLTS